MKGGNVKLCLPILLTKFVNITLNQYALHRHIHRQINSQEYTIKPSTQHKVKISFEIYCSSTCNDYNNPYFTTRKPSCYCGLEFYMK